MILVLNAGSSSLRVAVFDGDLRQIVSARVEEIGLGSGPADHVAALGRCLADTGTDAASLTAAAHRVVHGGAVLTKSGIVTPEVEVMIEACIPLAPLHNPANLAGIRAMRALRPDLPQVAVFDTAFHATNPAVDTTYALPQAERDRGLRRYGFHGISYASLTARLPGLTGLPLPSRLLALHLGNGASACAILNGKSVATTMGYSPLSGLTMGTRAGDIDGNAVLDLAARHGVGGAARILNRESGLTALGGTNDMRALHGFAVDHFCHWAIRHAGSLIAAMGGLDALAFSGGIGENDARVRGRIMDGLAFLGLKYDPAANDGDALCLHRKGSPVAAWTVPAAEEAHIAHEARRVLAEGIA